AAKVFLARAEREKDFPWSGEVVRLLGELPAGKALPALRKLWGEHGLDEEILPLLARKPEPEDHAKFLSGLSSARLATVGVSLEALEKLPARPGNKGQTRDEAFALVRALRQTGSGKEEAKLRARLLARLRSLTGRKLQTAEQWAAWARTTWPELAARLDDADGVDVAGWRRRLAKIDWGKGDAKTGQAVYVKASCSSCHSGVAALGPDLR